MGVQGGKGGLEISTILLILGSLAFGFQNCANRFQLQDSASQGNLDPTDPTQPNSSGNPGGCAPILITDSDQASIKLSGYYNYYPSSSLFEIASGSVILPTIPPQTIPVDITAAQPTSFTFTFSVPTSTISLQELETMLTTPSVTIVFTMVNGEQMSDVYNCADPAPLPTLSPTPTPIPTPTSTPPPPKKGGGS